MTTPDDLNRVRQLIGREPRGQFEVVVRDATGDPVVIRNAPLLDDGTPMPTRYWLVSAEENRRVGRLESTGGVDRAEADIDDDELRAAHERYAAERDADLPIDHTGPRPSGGVGGTRVGVKCLHAHWAWHLAGGDDPVGRWIADRLDDAAGNSPGTRPIDADSTSDAIDAMTVELVVEATTTTVATSSGTHVIDWGYENLTEAWLSATDPPRPDALTNALGAVDDHLDDVERLHPEVLHANSWRFRGTTIDSLADVEAGHTLPPGDVGYERSDAEEVFRLVATEAAADRSANPGLRSQHVNVIVATSAIVQATMRHFDLDAVVLCVGETV